MATLYRLSNTIVRDFNDRRNPGAKLYFYGAGTTTPLVVYADAAQTTPLNDSDGKVIADAYGRIPTIYVPFNDGYKERLVLSTGVVEFENDNVPNPAPTVFDGASVDPEIVAQTGDLWPSLATGPRSGWGRMNGNTLGNAASGATERANADAAGLYALLWNNCADAIAPVSGGRGASAAADFAANKTITLPNTQGRALIGVNGMGGALADLLTAITFTAGNQASVGSTTGAATHTLTVPQIPSHDHGGVTGSTNPIDKEPTFTPRTNSTSPPQYNSSPAEGTADRSAAHTHTIAAQGGGEAHPNVQPSLAVTYYVKL
jgi:microcystin-dependent protein